jgi:hypothetical protein
MARVAVDVVHEDPADLVLAVAETAPDPVVGEKEEARVLHPARREDMGARTDAHAASAGEGDAQALGAAALGIGLDPGDVGPERNMDIGRRPERLEQVPPDVALRRDRQDDGPKRGAEIGRAADAPGPGLGLPIGKRHGEERLGFGEPRFELLERDRPGRMHPRAVHVHRTEARADAGPVRARAAIGAEPREGEGMVRRTRGFGPEVVLPAQRRPPVAAVEDEDAEAPAEEPLRHRQPDDAGAHDAEVGLQRLAVRPCGRGGDHGPPLLSAASARLIPPTRAPARAPRARGAPRDRRAPARPGSRPPARPGVPARRDG